MEQYTAEEYILKNSIYFEPNKIAYIREELGKLKYEQLNIVKTADLKNPSKVFVISIFAGIIGADRFLIGDIKMGVLKLMPVIISFIIAYFGFIWLIATYETEPVADQALKLMHILKYFWIISFVWVVADWFFIKLLTKRSNYKTISRFFNR